MISKKSNVKICCDLVGCNNLAEFTFKLSPQTYDCDALNLCGKCLSCILKGYKNLNKKGEIEEKINEKN